MCVCVCVCVCACACIYKGSVLSVNGAEARRQVSQLTS